MSAADLNLRIDTTARVIESETMRQVAVEFVEELDSYRFHVDWGFLPAEALQPPKRVAGYIHVPKFVLESKKDLERFARDEAASFLDTTREAIAKQIGVTP